MIKIITGWSNKGGSTFALINLCNYLNEDGYECIMYGPHEWHLDKCNSGLLKDFVPEKSDTVIMHFLNLPKKLPVKRTILSCHEKDLYEVGKIPQTWDEAVFINDKHKRYHSEYNGKFTIIPNFTEELEKKEKSEDILKVAGIIGSFDPNKQTHLSIERALKEEVILFGNVSDETYYNEFVKPLIDKHDEVVESGFVADKQAIYDQVGAVFHSSKSEVASLVKDECRSTGTKFCGNFATSHDSPDMTFDEILDAWIEILKV